MLSDYLSNRRLVACAIRHDGHLPLAVRAAHARTGLPHRHHGDPLRPHGATNSGSGPPNSGCASSASISPSASPRGIILEFEFGTNWSNYSHFVGDIFGAPLAVEGIFAFFLESDLHRRDVLRLAQGFERLPPHGHVAHGHRGQPLGVVDSGGQRVDAIPRGRAISTSKPCATR